jgi:small-conductance mechanosensitive channel
MPWDPEFWTRILSGILADLAGWLPSLAGALLLLFIGWIVARLSQVFLAGLLRRLGLDRLAERAGMTRALTNLGVETSTATLLARLVYWLILLVFILAAVESLGLQGVTETLGGLVAYLPRVLAAALILLLGSLIARVIGDALGALATQSGIGTGPVVGQAIRYVLLIFVVILALEQLGVETTLLTTVTLALILATALALALAFGMGSRELARNIMAGFHAKDEFVLGQHLIVGGYTGRLINIGAVKSVIETEAGRVSLPNFTLIDQEVLVATEAEDQPGEANL